MSPSVNEPTFSRHSVASDQEKKSPTTFVVERKPLNGEPLSSVAPQRVNKQQQSTPSKEEEPKAPVSDSRWMALKRCLPVLAPIPVTVALVTLHFKQVVYLSAEERYINEVTKALVLANAVYSLLLVGSVSAIALHRIQYELTQGDGVALGHLLAGYQLNQLTTLLSKGFWTSSYTNHRGGSRPQHLSLVGLVALCMFLVHLGPQMGTILLIPESGWWSVSSKQANSSIIAAYISNQSELYPHHLTQSSLSDSLCLSSNALLNESCPAGGYSTILETLPNWNAESLGEWNLTFFNDDVGRDVVAVPLMNASFAWLDSSRASSPQHVFARALANYFQWSHNWKLTLTGINKMPLLMPLVQVQCAPMSSPNVTIEFPYDNLIYPPLSALANTTIFALNASELPENSQTPIQFSWVNLSAIDHGPSLGAVVRLTQLPSNLTGSTISDGSTMTPLSNETTIACTIDARWAPVNLYFQPYSDGTVHPDNVFPDPRTPNLTQIMIDPTWANSLNLLVPNTGLTSMETLIQSLVQTTLEDSDISSFLTELSVALGLTLTDGIARIGWQEPFAYTTQNGKDPVQLNTISDNGTVLNSNAFSAQEAANWLLLDWKIEHYGYGYSANTIVAKIAIAVLLLQALLAIGHTIVVCFPKKVWTCDGWGTISSLVVLAMNSKPDERLLNMSAGIKLKRSWQEIVEIRELGEENLQLLIAEDVDGEKGVGKQDGRLKANKVYGTDLGN